MKTRNQVVAALMHWPSDTFIDHVHKLIVDNDRLMQTNEWYENRLISVSEEKDRRIRELEEALTQGIEVINNLVRLGRGYEEDMGYDAGTFPDIKKGEELISLLKALNPPKP